MLIQAEINVLSPYINIVDGKNNRPCLVLLTVEVNFCDPHMKSSKMIWFMSYVWGLAAAVMATIAAGMPDIRSMLNGNKDWSENFLILVINPFLLVTINWNIWNKSYFELRIKIWMKVNMILAVEWSCSLHKIYGMFKSVSVKCKCKCNPSTIDNLPRIIKTVCDSAPEEHELKFHRRLVFFPCPSLGHTCHVWTFGNNRAIYTRKNKTRTVPFIRACLI